MIDHRTRKIKATADILAGDAGVGVSGLRLV